MYRFRFLIKVKTSGGHCNIPPEKISLATVMFAEVHFYSLPGNISNHIRGKQTCFIYKEIKVIDLEKNAYEWLSMYISYVHQTFIFVFHF